MDITEQFNLIVRNILILPNSPYCLPNKDRILGKSNSNALSGQAKVTLKKIEAIKNFFDQTKEDYVKEPGTDGVTFKRHEIDFGATALIQTAENLITNFRADLRKTKSLNSQESVHYYSVLELLEEKLKKESKLFSFQKEIVLEKENATKEMGSLRTKIDDVNEGLEVVNKNTVIDSSSSEDELSPEELKAFQTENDAMFDNLNKVKGQLADVESKVVKIAELQELFSEKVLGQKEDIGLISSNAVAATENIKDGNEELRKAIRNKASIRVYILFFLLVMSFSLIFLDWYND